MIVEPKTRGFICTTAHPEGCRQNVKQQIDYVKSQESFRHAKRVLVIGCSTGYGLSSRITCAFAGGTSTIGVMFERPSANNRTATAGWYNTAAFEQYAAQQNLYAKTINGDAFSKEIKQKTIDLIQADLDQIDLVVYSLASPRRTLEDGSTVSSVLKTTNSNYTNKTINLKTKEISDITIFPASKQEIFDTIQVMGGDDWMQWISALQKSNVLSKDAVTVAYSYIGPEITHPIYKDGTIGKAKQHLLNTSRIIEHKFNISAYISVNKALVTQSSAAIPIVPLYISLLYKIMKQKGLHEGCIEQMYRLFAKKLTTKPETDENAQIRLDDWEMQPDVQAEIVKAWDQINNDNIQDFADIDGYWQDFYNMFGFHILGVDYKKDVAIDVPVASIQS